MADRAKPLTIQPLPSRALTETRVAQAMTRRGPQLWHTMGLQAKMSATQAPALPGTLTPSGVTESDTRDCVRVSLWKSRRREQRSAGTHQKPGFAYNLGSRSAGGDSLGHCSHGRRVTHHAEKLDESSRASSQEDTAGRISETVTLDCGNVWGWRGAGLWDMADTSLQGILEAGSLMTARPLALSDTPPHTGLTSPPSLVLRMPRRSSFKRQQFKAVSELSRHPGSTLSHTHRSERL
ncbi:Hypothetical predicted protein [Pelobates cultripes]|uniref:Uncharacterized protein n=1 Tax=Pelobates cultripes TaxID=61616 RepID=A0AAD1QZQ2_PELCU|nr:Hypothetical predicted protein [Pelobates cultripes]